MVPPRKEERYNDTVRHSGERAWSMMPLMLSLLPLLSARARFRNRKTCSCLARVRDEGKVGEGERCVVGKGMAPRSVGRGRA